MLYKLSKCTDTYDIPVLYKLEPVTVLSAAQILNFFNIPKGQSTSSCPKFIKRRCCCLALMLVLNSVYA